MGMMATMATTMGMMTASLLRMPPQPQITLPLLMPSPPPLKPLALPCPPPWPQMRMPLPQMPSQHLLRPLV
jgi:hypothetical protein